ncbi:MAG: acyl-CoA dehydrogenase family protein [Phototrophicaceae bacterium]
MISEWTPEQQALYDEMRTFATSSLNDDDVQARDHQGIFAENYWQRCAEKGIFGLYMPTEYGGQGHSILTSVRALEGLGYGCRDNGFTLAINGQIWTVQEVLLHYANEAQKQKYLPRLIDGSLKGAHAITEENAGSDAFNLSTIAEAVDGGFRLNGSKMIIGRASVADFIILFASTNPDIGRWGITAFILDTTSDGVSISEPIEKMGLRTDWANNLIFEDVFIPEDCVIGNVGAGAQIFNASAVYERGFIFASHVGSMARQLDETVAFAKKRKQGGQSIGKYQSVSNRLVDMKVRLETSRLLMYRAAAAIDRGEDITLDSAMAKLTISESFVQNSMDAIRVLGGRGYLTEYDVERDLRDAMGGVLYGGTSDIQRNIIARMMGVG